MRNTLISSIVANKMTALLIFEVSVAIYDYNFCSYSKQVIGLLEVFTAASGLDDFQDL